MTDQLSRGTLFDPMLGDRPYQQRLKGTAHLLNYLINKRFLSMD